MDKAVEYTQKLENFVKTLNTENPGLTGDTWKVETGRKFDKVYVQTPNQKLGRYMVDRNSWQIFGIKSWAQINPRRTFGTIDVVNQYDWSGYTGIPKSGTQAERIHGEIELKITSGYKKRGRPRKVAP
jgi:hypothetical protein